MFCKVVLAASLLRVAFAQGASSSAMGTASPAAPTNAVAPTSAEPTRVGTPSLVSSTESGVPTGTPVPGNYAGALRPQVHYSPSAGFMNDPNGMFVDDNGTWHLYYQCSSSSQTDY